MSGSAYTPWWGDYRLDSGQTGQWRVGTLEMTLQRLPLEWQIRYRNIVSDNDTADGAEVCLSARPVDEPAVCHRYVLKLTRKPIQVLPALADRPVVIRPVTPFHLSPVRRCGCSSALWSGCRFMPATRVRCCWISRYSSSPISGSVPLPVTGRSLTPPAPMPGWN